MSKHSNQHYVPRLYLRAFAHEGRVTLRRRGAEPKPAGIAHVAAVKHLYSLTLPDGTRNTSAERTIGKFEDKAAATLREIRGGGPIPQRGTDERRALALFLGLQLVRTPETSNRWMFPANVAKHANIDRPTPEHVHTYLRDEHLGFEPTEQEVLGAHAFVSAALHLGPPTKAQLLDFMFTAAIQLAPLFEQMQWTVEECSEPRLVTCDRLPAMWRTPVEADRYEGVGIETAEELWLPLDPSSLLVLRDDGTEGRTKVDTDRTRGVNRHLARHCYTAVFHDPRLRPDPDELMMATVPLTARFNSGPLIVEGQPTAARGLALGHRSATTPGTRRQRSPSRNWNAYAFWHMCSGAGNLACVTRLLCVVSVCVLACCSSYSTIPVWGRFERLLDPTTPSFTHAADLLSAARVGMFRAITRAFPVRSPTWLPTPLITPCLTVEGAFLVAALPSTSSFTTRCGTEWRRSKMARRS